LKRETAMRFFGCPFAPVMATHAAITNIIALNVLMAPCSSVTEVVVPETNVQKTIAGGNNGPGVPSHRPVTRGEGRCMLAGVDSFVFSR